MTIRRCILGSAIRFDIIYFFVLVVCLVSVVCFATVDFFGNSIGFKPMESSLRFTTISSPCLSISVTLPIPTHNSLPICRYVRPFCRRLYAFSQSYLLNHSEGCCVTVSVAGLNGYDIQPALMALDTIVGAWDIRVIRACMSRVSSFLILSTSSFLCR